MGAGDEKDVEDLAVAEGLVNLVAGSDEDKAGKENGENSECCAVEYTEKWKIGNVHSLKRIVTNSMGKMLPVKSAMRLIWI